jgi:hypothetical protein
MLDGRIGRGGGVGVGRGEGTGSYEGEFGDYVLLLTRERGEGRGIEDELSRRGEKGVTDVGSAP